jgi:hypothetical protein
MDAVSSGSLELWLKNMVWLLGVIWLVIQIIKSLRRSPPAEKEFESKTDATACQQRCAAYRTRNDADNQRRDKDSSESRARLYNLIETLRRDMDAGMRELGEQGAGQEKQIEMMNQRQIQMDLKIDTLLQRK